jgi:signal transduction histidine kinase
VDGGAAPGGGPGARREEIQLGDSTFLGLSFPITTQGQHLAIGEIMLDISQQKRIQHELIGARAELQKQARQLAARNAELIEADRLKTDLVNTVSHELRTPLTSILGYCELLTDAGLGEPGSAPGRMIEMISRNSARLLSLIDNLLLLAKLDGRDPALSAAHGAPAAIAVTDLVDAVTAMILPTARAAGLDLVTDVGERLLVASGDRDQLERALINLASNAVKFSRRGGVISIRARGETGQVLIEVVDQGIGMAAHELAQIGTRFFRGETAREGQVQGTGLGVSVVRSIVENHGGSLSYESCPGEGTTARVLLPSAARDAPGTAGIAG